MDSMNYELSFLKKLVALNTDAELKLNYTECAKLILEEATKLGLKTKIINVKAPDKLPRPNVIIELDKGAKESMLIVTHYDVVSADDWKNAFKMKKKEDILYGRGVNDDKGAIAASFGALKELSKEKELKRNIKLVCACDEETGGAYGIKYLADNMIEELKSEFALVVDGSFDNVQIGCSGIIKGQIILKEKSFHAGYPFRGKNVIEEAIPFLNELKEYSKIMEKQISKAPAPPDAPFKNVWGRFSLTVLRAGRKSNVVPGRLKIMCDIRLIPEANVKKELNKFRRFTKKLLKKYKLKGRIYARGTEGYFIGENNKYANEVQEIGEKLFNSKKPQVCALGGADGRFLHRNGIDAISFGPGGLNPHTEEESITLQELIKVKELIMNLSKIDEQTKLM
jgi:succinyl-diaminopimelate desuccinylase